MFCVYQDPTGEEQERAKWKGREHPRTAGLAWVRKPLVCEVRLWERYRPACQATAPWSWRDTYVWGH